MNSEQHAKVLATQQAERFAFCEGTQVDPTAMHTPFADISVRSLDALAYYMFCVSIADHNKKERDGNF